MEPDVAPPAKLNRKRAPGEGFVSRAQTHLIKRATISKPVASGSWITWESCKRVLLYMHIAMFTREYALKEKMAQKENLNVNTATDEQLHERLELYCRGVSTELVHIYRDTTKRVAFTYEGVQLLCIPELGEVLNGNGQLLGHLSSSFSSDKIKVHLNRKNFQRSHLVLNASGKARPDGHTADHLNPSLPLNDSLENLAWATCSDQNSNKVFSNHVLSNAQTILAVNSTTGEERRFESQYLAATGLGSHHSLISRAIKKSYRIGRVWRVSMINCGMMGRLLPPHPTHQFLQLTDEMTYRTSTTGFNRVWRAVSGERPVIQIGGTSYQLHKIALESLLGREMVTGEQGDHINGDAFGCLLSNLWPVSASINCTKKDQQLRVGKATGTTISTLYLSQHDASSLTLTHANNISSACHGKLKQAGGYEWRFASTEELNTAFDLVQKKVACKTWDEILEMLEEFKGDHYYQVMKAQAQLSKEYADKLAEWRAAPERENV
jgi:hypothetical protein